MVGRSRRVLLIAEAANPEWVSVPLVGYSHAKAICDLTDAHLVTQVRNRGALLRAGWVEGRDFTAIDSESVARPLTLLAERVRGGAGRGWTTKMAISALAMPLFWKLLWDRFGRSVREGRFDIVHQLTPLSPTINNPLAGRIRRAGAHFVWGPLNGGVPWPGEFDRERRAEREWLSYVRDAYRLLPGYLDTRRHASAIVVASRDTFEQMPRSFRRKCVYLPENAIDPTRFARRRSRVAARPVRAVFLGRLVPYKGCDMLLEAATPLIRDGRLTLKILGDGPQRRALESIIDSNQLRAGVEMVGWVNHAQVQDHLVDADLFTFPSIREFGGGVAVEAMAVGLPPVVVNYGGLGELVTDQTGWRIPIGSRASIISNLRALLSELCDDPTKIDAKAPAALERAHRLFTWEAKARQTLEIYRRLREGGPVSSMFATPWD